MTIGIENYSSKPFIGQELSKITECNKWFGFDDPDQDKDSPTLVLAAVHKVPNDLDGWFMASQTCGGFLCWEQFAAIKLLKLKPEYKLFLEKICNEDWASESLDYLGFCEPESNAVKEYQLFIEQYDLVFSSKNEHGIKLAQALYPLDASNEQIAKLADSDDLIDVDIIDPNGDCGLVLFIVGDNRD